MGGERGSGWDGGWTRGSYKARSSFYGPLVHGPLGRHQCSVCSARKTRETGNDRWKGGKKELIFIFGYIILSEIRQGRVTCTIHLYINNILYLLFFFFFYRLLSRCSIYCEPPRIEEFYPYFVPELNGHFLMSQVEIPNYDKFVGD